MLHKHDATDEGFFVVSGVLEVQLGEERVQVPTGSFVWVPGGVAHAFANGGPEPLQVLALALPGGIEDLFRMQAAYFASLDGPPDVDVLREMGERHGARTLGPPIRASNARLRKQSRRGTGRAEAGRIVHQVAARRTASVGDDLGSSQGPRCPLRPMSTVARHLVDWPGAVRPLS